MTASSGSSPSESSPSDGGSGPPEPSSQTPSESVTGDESGFDSNWAYLKTELKWLERVLLRAVARRRQTQTRVERCANSAADRATQHWWQGLIVLDQPAGHDSYHKPPTDPTPKLTYSQRLDHRIQSSSQAGTVLGIPSLCDRLQLTPFEKAVVLTSLAPEVNRRYGQLYRYLQGDEGSGNSASPSPPSDLPAVDLVLRLFCRNDAAWRTARERLVQSSPLIRVGLLRLVTVLPDEPLLNHRLKLAAPLTNYLLADQPDPQVLDQLASPLSTVEPTAPSPVSGTSVGIFTAESTAQNGSMNSNNEPRNCSRGAGPLFPTQFIPRISHAQPSSRHNYLTEQSPTTEWSDLILPAAIRASLQQLVLDQPNSNPAVQNSGSRPAASFQLPGRIILLVGEPGTGKTLVANAFATALQTSLTQVDLALLHPEDYAGLWAEISRRSPTILLMKSAQHILSRTARINPTDLHQWFHHRRQQAGMTVLSACWLQSIRPSWQQTCDAVFQLPRPNQAARRQLWQQALAHADLSVEPLPDASINWDTLAKRFNLTGGEIQAIVQLAQRQAQTEGAAVTWQHLQSALTQWRTGCANIYGRCDT